ncbi:MAG: hypothetical protein HRU11_01730 [Parvularculaceae bacterium]|nr:hypothetical protein [Parvularculaceae bacterium]
MSQVSSLSLARLAALASFTAMSLAPVEVAAAHGWVRLCRSDGSVVMVPFPAPDDGSRDHGHSCHAPCLCERRKLSLPQPDADRES